ncbi:MAG: holo-ACP synthase [Planctomycetota bacterium]
MTTPPRAPLLHGVDLIEIARVAEMLEKHGERFLERCFTEGERSYCESGGRRIEHYAARLAAKEAAFKAIGTGWARGVGWHDAEVVRAESGAPGLVLSGKAAEFAAQLGVVGWAISLSHTPTAAVASVIGWTS